MSHHFSISETFGFAWRALRAHSRIVLPAGVLFAMLGFVDGSLAAGPLSVANGAATACVLLLSFVFTIGFNRMTLRLARGHEARLSDLVPTARLAWVYALAALLQIIIIFAGLVLLIIPGLYLLVRLYFVGFAVIDGAHPRQALRESLALTREGFWRVAALVLMLAVLSWLGGATYIGVLITAPLVSLANAHAYQKLKNKIPMYK